MKRALLWVSILTIAIAAIAAPTTTNNDDSCDISALPAATLLLPYFEVDLSSRNGADTLFSVTNVTHLPRIARVTIWTDYAYPLFSFNVFLTGCTPTAPVTAEDGSAPAIAPAKQRHLHGSTHGAVDHQQR